MAARNELPVVLRGESGTGKELFAQAIHSDSSRAEGPFVAVNCGCIPAALLEAELFGYEPGTFTGGRREGNAGKFEKAAEGTIFLDEVTELPPQAQAALLRVLQEREVVRLGGSSPRRIDTRVIAASNASLADAVRTGRFRADLYYRLNVLPIAIPPLRERREDVPLLARAFLREAEAEVGRSGLSFSDEAIASLEAHPWPGNIRELRNIVLRCAATAATSVIGPADLPPEVRATHVAPRGPAAGRGEAGELDREALIAALQASAWNVARTAHDLKVSRMTLYRWLRKFHIDR
jgi:sigma-54 dependent transcriptional regulator, acetoin dehydrogenase operon transcriptional activator AcoR